MCGRFVESRPVEDLVETFAIDEVDLPPELAEARWNIAPQATILAVSTRQPHGGLPARRRLTAYRWGLVPSWAKDPSFGARAFNARADAIEERPAFRAAVAKRRCLIPADAFYEWKKEPSRSTSKRPSRQPWCFRPADGGVMAFAGLWEAWRPRVDEEAEWLLTCTIVTTEANTDVAPIHSRMPAVLEPEAWDEWLSPEPLAPAELRELLRPARTGYLEGFPVSPDVNDARAEGARLIEPFPIDSPTLFEMTSSTTEVTADPAAKTPPQNGPAKPGKRSC